MTRGQLILRIAGVLFVVSMYWWVPAALRSMSFFGVRRVQVTGARYLAADTIVQALGLGPDASVFDDLGVLEQRLRGLAGVESVRLTRWLPATLRVAVTEVEPVALAEGPEGLVPLSREGRVLPYDVVAAPVDVPVVRAADRSLLEALRLVQITDPGLYADVAAARVSGGAMVLEMTRGRVRLDLPADAGIVRSVSAVRRDLEQRDVAWRELDGRFRGWVVVRTDEACGRAGVQACGMAPTRTAVPRMAPVRRAPPRPAVRRPARRAGGVDSRVCTPARLHACTPGLS